jgi:hypothetical protein
VQQHRKNDQAFRLVSSTDSAGDSVLHRIELWCRARLVVVGSYVISFCVPRGRALPW